VPHPTLLELPERIETPRLLVRRYLSGDGAWYLEMGRRNRDHLQRYEAGNSARRVATPEEAEVLVRTYGRDWDARVRFLMGAFERATGEFVAQLYAGPLSWEAREFEVGYFVDADHEGRGFVTEAVLGVRGWLFEHLGARRLVLRCEDTNLRSARVAERCGFRQEGHLRENNLREGQYTGTLCFGLLRAEVEERHAGERRAGG